ncbi:MAG TPA: CPBP family intramembrane glutamic endopeptidase [Bradyrhizobium sp.]|nr:CPBP family intramembrane glutamic endopeptidase [Bradyrhizobium sp.]
MSNRDEARGRRFVPFAVLLVGTALCFLILWGGGRIAALVMPGRTAAVDETIGSGIIFGLLLVAGLAGGALCGVDAARLGPSGGRKLIEGAAIGCVGLLIATLLAAIAGVLRQSQAAPSAGLIAWGTALILLQVASEEVFFRGWIQPVLVKAWGAAGIVVTAIAFALLHLVGGAISVLSVLNLFLGGLLFGLLAARSGGIAAAVAAHFLWNWTEQLVVGLDPNPGSGSFGSILNLDLVGSSWWGGSAEGLNASVAMTMALAAVLSPLLILAVRTGQPLEQRRSASAPV